MSRILGVQSDGQTWPGKAGRIRFPEESLGLAKQISYICSMDFNLIFATSLCCQIMVLKVLLKLDVHFSRLVSVASRSSDPANE